MPKINKSTCSKLLNLIIIKQNKNINIKIFVLKLFKVISIKGHDNFIHYYFKNIKY